MTDPQFPPPPPFGSAPAVPPAPGGHPAIPPYQNPPAQQQAPTYQTPPGAYAAPVGGYGAPAGGYQPPQAAEPKSATLGIVSFVLSIVAAVVAPIFAGIAGYQIGFGLPTVMDDVDSATSDLSVFSPVREQVLLGEIGFWAGTLAGIAAIVLAIMAIAKRQGRTWGIIALILGVIGPMIFFIVLSITLAAGAGSGAVSYYGS